MCVRPSVTDHGPTGRHSNSRPATATRGSLYCAAPPVTSVGFILPPPASRHNAAACRSTPTPGHIRHASEGIASCFNFVPIANAATETCRRRRKTRSSVHSNALFAVLARVQYSMASVPTVGASWSHVREDRPGSWPDFRPQRNVCSNLKGARMRPDRSFDTGTQRHGAEPFWRACTSRHNATAPWASPTQASDPAVGGRQQDEP
jgi:hypothetical protein